MNLLIYEWNGYGYTELKNALSENGIHFDVVVYRHDDTNHNEELESLLLSKLKKHHYDAALSYNYFPILSRFCYQNQLKYISWSYDSPINADEFCETLAYPTNYAFFFDKIQAQDLQAKGIDNVFHLPLAVNAKRLSTIFPTKEQVAKYASDFAFVGMLYQSPFPDIWKSLPPYLQGYLKAIIHTQQKLYGCYLIDEMLTEDLIKSVSTEYTSGQNAQYFRKNQLSIAMATYITNQERLSLLNLLSTKGATKLYSLDTHAALRNVVEMGPVTYMDLMPVVFKTTKINLNISLKCIQSGIPLRAMDILGSGGFLLSNFQPELAEYFIDGEELVLYTSMEDAAEKASFYLVHDNLRRKIAAKGFRKAQQEFSFERKLAYLFDKAKL